MRIGYRLSNSYPRRALTICYMDICFRRTQDIREVASLLNEVWHLLFNKICRMKLKGARGLTSSQFDWNCTQGTISWTCVESCLFVGTDALCRFPHHQPLKVNPRWPSTILDSGVVFRQTTFWPQVLRTPGTFKLSLTTLYTTFCVEINSLDWLPKSIYKTIEGLQTWDRARYTISRNSQINR